MLDSVHKDPTCIMPVARAQALNHILDTLCKDGINNAFGGIICTSLANAGIASAQDIVALNHADLLTLQHSTLPTDSTLVNLSLGGREMIAAVICMNMNANNDHGNGLSLEDWVAVAKEEFDNFHISNLCAANQNSFTNPGSARPILRATTSSTPGTRDKVYDCK